MGTYRIYRLDGVGRIRGAEWLDALDDRFAIEGARQLAGSSPCELWQRDRMVARLTTANEKGCPALSNRTPSLP